MIVNMAFFNKIGIQNIVIYLLVINLVSFFAMWLDKQKAKKGEWRTPEATLMSLVVLGGGIGGIAGMYMFRHKTKKPKFFIGFPAILIAEIVTVVYILIKG